MPALLWVAFWSCMMGSAACFGDAPKADAPEASKMREKAGRDHPAV